MRKLREGGLDYYAWVHPGSKCSMNFQPRWSAFDSSPLEMLLLPTMPHRREQSMVLNCSVCSVPGTQVNGRSVFENYFNKTLKGIEIDWAIAK